MIALILSLISMILFGTSSFLLKIPSQKMDAKTLIFLRGIFVCFLLLIILPFYGVKIIESFALFTFGISILGYISLYLLFRSLSTIKVSIVIPIANSSVIITALLSIFFYGEKLNLIRSIAFSLIPIGIFLISLSNPKEFRISKEIKIPLFLCFIWGIVFFLVKIPISVIGAFSTTLLVEFGQFATSLIIFNLSKKPVFVKDKKVILLLLIGSISSVIGFLTFNVAVSMYSLSIVSMIAFSNPIVSVILSYKFYKERVRLHQYFAMFLILIGITLIFI